MPNLFDALQAAAKMGEQPKTGAANAKDAPKSETKHKDTPKQTGGVKYVIPASFKQAIEAHLKGRADMAEKLKRKGKSIDKCCEYIYGVMLKRAQKERNGSSVVGMYAEPDEIFGLAVHYYDESDEDLQKEK